jgi:integrase
MKGRDGQTRPTFYGRYTDRDGKLVEENLEVKICGRAPSSLSDEGDAEFERSRGKALNELKKRKESASVKRVVKSDAVRTFKRSTAKELKQTSVDDLPAILTAITPKSQSPGWGQWRRKVVGDFVAWARREKIRYVMDVTPSDVKKYLLLQYQPDKKGYQKTVVTVRKIKTVLGRVFSTALDEGASNPFKHDDTRVERAEGDTSHNRKPLTEDEVERLLEAAKKDRLVYDLIVCGLCTGARRGDVARLKWKSVDLRKEVIEMTTQKTGAEVTIPILPRLREVLEARLAEKRAKEKYVFPEARSIIDSKPARLSYRIKRVFAIALSNGIEDAQQVKEDAPERENLATVLTEVLETIQGDKMTDKKRNHMTDVLTLYADGKSYREIQQNMKISRASISELLHLAEEISGRHFIVDKRPSFSVKRAIVDMTRESREHGTRAASVYDFHALRTSFITTAITGGMHVEIVKKITGHKLTDTIIDHYLKPKGIVYHELFMAAMPASLTAPTQQRQIEAPTEGKKESRITELLKTMSAEERKELQQILNQNAVSN